MFTVLHLLNSHFDGKFDASFWLKFQMVGFVAFCAQNHIIYGRQQRTNTVLKYTNGTEYYVVLALARGFSNSTMYWSTGVCRTLEYITPVYCTRVLEYSTVHSTTVVESTTVLNNGVEMERDSTTVPVVFLSGTLYPPY